LLTPFEIQNQALASEIENRIAATAEMPTARFDVNLIEKAIADRLDGGRNSKRFQMCAFREGEWREASSLVRM
jgi:hypothetical protein